MTETSPRQRSLSLDHLDLCPPGALEDDPVPGKTPAWQITLEASSFQYLLSPALLLDQAIPSRTRTIDALLPKVLSVVAPAAATSASRPASSTPGAANVKGPATGKKRGRPKAKKLDKDGNERASAEYYDDDDDYETAPAPVKRKGEHKSSSASRARQQLEGSVEDDEEQERPYGTRRAAVRRKRRSGSSESLNSMDFLMDDSDDGAPAPAPMAFEQQKKSADFGQKWSAKDDALLLRLGPRVNGESWLQITEHFPARTIRGVKQRWRNLSVLKRRKSGASPTEDVDMKPAVTHRGPAAGVITSEDAEIDYESYESEEDDGARETKDNRGAQGAKWTAADDIKLMELAAGREKGESWIKIAAAFPGRPTNSAKQRWQRLTKREEALNA
ncbi:hypothetical protein RQP46_009692 [Phenoliferia psychrophenolica]